MKYFVYQINRKYCQNIIYSNILLFMMVFKKGVFKEKLKNLEIELQLRCITYVINNNEQIYLYCVGKC